MREQGSIAPSGELTMKVIRGSRVSDGGLDAEPTPALSLRTIVEHGLPQRGLPAKINAWRLRNMRHLWRGVWRYYAAKLTRTPTITGALWMTVRRGNGDVEQLGLASLRVVTTAGVNKIVAVLNTTDAVTGINFKFHGYGTGTTAEASTDTALVTELTTEYNPNSTRPTGTQTVGASNNIYRTVATLTPDSGTPVLREHGVFSQAATGGGTLLDRTVFAAVTLDSSAGDSLQTTYECTFPAGS